MRDDDLRLQIDQAGVRRELVGPFKVCLSREVALLLVDQLTRVLDDEDFLFGWVDVRPPLLSTSPHNVPPLGWAQDVAPVLDVPSILTLRAFVGPSTGVYLELLVAAGHEPVDFDRLANVRYYPDDAPGDHQLVAVPGGVARYRIKEGRGGFYSILGSGTATPVFGVDRWAPLPFVGPRGDRP